MTTIQSGGYKCYKYCVLNYHTSLRCTRSPECTYENQVTKRCLFQLIHFYSERRLYLDLSTMYKIVHNTVFPSGIFCESVGRTPRSLLFYRPYARTNYFYNSFVPCILSMHGIIYLPLLYHPPLLLFLNLCCG